jgi:uncharacterized membrane protein YhfC
MITGIGLFFRIVNGLIMVGVPLAVALYFWRKGKMGFRPIWIGALVFVLSQVGHIPFNQFLMLPGLRALGFDLAAQRGISLWVLGVAAGLSAGVFEEFARYLAFKYWLKEEPHSLLPVKYGVGHGGVEAFILGLFTFAALVQVLIFRNESAFASLPPEQVELARSQIEAYWNVPLGQLLLGAWERISAMLFHVGASLLVYKSVRSGNWLWLGTAIIGHTVFNAFAVIAFQSMDFILLEAILFLFAVGWIFWAWQVREGDLPEHKMPAPPGPVQIAAAQATQDQIEESRYE